MSSGKVRTVLGDIDPSDLGRTMMHEHLLIGFARWQIEAGSIDTTTFDDARSAEATARVPVGPEEIGRAHV